MVLNLAKTFDNQFEDGHSVKRSDILIQVVLFIKNLELIFDESLKGLLDTGPMRLTADTIGVSTLERILRTVGSETKRYGLSCRRAEGLF